ncbi:MAG TPA: hypothetical protein PK477_03535 [Methanoregulaceae archaeon]|nr:hypothetical protein [Methanoregulaceae archaeon]
MYPDQKKAIPVMPLVLAALVCIVSPCTAAIYIQASHDCVLAKGDPLFITGDGYHNGSAVIWGIGHSFFIHEIVDADSDGTLTWTWDEKVTEKFHSGPFTIIVQDPGQDRIFSIVANDSAGKSLLTIADNVSVLPVDAPTMDIPAALDLADFLKNQIAGSGMDDSYLLQTVYVEEPTLHLSTVELGSPLKVPAGGYVLVQGTMNMALENRIAVRIYDTSVIEKTSHRIPVRAIDSALTGSGVWGNTWEYSLDTAGLGPGEYLVEIGWDRSVKSGQNVFILMVTGNESMMDKMLKELLWRTPKFFGCV